MTDIFKTTNARCQKDVNAFLEEHKSKLNDIFKAYEEVLDKAEKLSNGFCAEHGLAEEKTIFAKRLELKSNQMKAFLLTTSELFNNMFTKHRIYGRPTKI